MKTFISLLCVFLTTSVLGQHEPKSPEYVRFYNPALGFKPAQTNLTNIFLQLAGSLEAHGSPEPYIRHIQAENIRVLTLFTKKTGKPQRSRVPAHMTDAYLERFIANWNALSPKLDLDELAKEAGRCVREGIRGTRDTGTVVVELFNEHQELVVEGMKHGSSKEFNFDRLRAKIETDLEFHKDQVTLVGYETARRDAVRYALILEATFSHLFEKIDVALSPSQATQIKSAIKGAFLDSARLTQSELELGILEWSLSH